MTSKLKDLAFLIVVFLVVVHFSIGFDELSPIGWSMIGAIIVAWFVIDVVFDPGTESLKRMLGLASGEGPLRVTAADQGEALLLTLTNEGMSNMTLAGVQGLDQRGKRRNPTHYSAGSAQREKIGFFRMLSAYRLAGGQTGQIVLDKRELELLGCRSLVAVDSSGRDWPVQWQKAAPH